LFLHLYERDGALSQALVALDDAPETEFDLYLRKDPIEHRAILPAVPGREGLGVDPVHEGVDVLVLAVVMRD
jgi:hypothetical protein